MEHTEVAGLNNAEKALTKVKENFDALFENAPVMVHSLGQDGKLIKVNRLWLQKLGYDWEEVQGRKPTDFLTEESRLWANNDTLPLFWRTGSAHSIGYQFIKGDGRVIDLLLDAELSHDAAGRPITIAALYRGDDLIQWRQASATIRALQSLAGVRQPLVSIDRSARLTQRELEVLRLIASGAQ